ncbi:MAG: chemotaxis protein CheW [Desulfuromonadaceae bacterium]|nr:chemotaxis protein CheW [Desulfuromonadaceae bacterium]MDD2854644.1 chemotaxis protein CheW [Desulfuromonadaceae bacterium]
MTASPANTTIQLVTFLLNGEEYGIDVMKVREISSMAEITRTANSPSFVKGVINLRGAIVPIISLRNRLGFPDISDESSCCIAIMDFKGELTGFVIDEISDVIRINISDIQPPPIDNTSQPWIEGILNVNNKLIVFLNLMHLI